MELYKVEKRKEVDRDSQEDKGGIKRRETDPGSNQFPMVLHCLEHAKRFTEFGREERGREETEATWWRKRRVQRGGGECSQASNLSAK